MFLNDLIWLLNLVLNSPSNVYSMWSLKVCVRVLISAVTWPGRAMIIHTSLDICCKFRLLLVVEVPHCKRSLVTCFKIHSLRVSCYSLQKSKYTFWYGYFLFCFKIHSLRVSCYSFQKSKYTFWYGYFFLPILFCHRLLKKFKKTPKIKNKKRLKFT